MNNADLPSKDELLAMAVAANPDFARLMAERARLEAQMAALVNPAGGGASVNQGRVFPVASPKDLRAEQAEWTAKRDAVSERLAALKSDARYTAARAWEEARAALAEKALAQRQAAKRQEESRTAKPLAERPKAKADDPLPRARKKAVDAYQAHFDATRPLDRNERLGRLAKMPKMDVLNRPKKTGKDTAKSAPDLDARLTAARQSAKDRPAFSVDALADRAKSRKDKREPMFDLRRPKRTAEPSKTAKRKPDDDLDKRRERALAAKKKRKSLLGRFA